MIKLLNGDLFKDDAQALVNTVNCVGVMGKGIALQFAKKYDFIMRPYQTACKTGELTIGKVHTVPTGMLIPQYIINFPTKNHWKGKSKLGDIEAGLKALVAEVHRLQIRSIAIPPLGCGNGGLRWGHVEPLIQKAFADLPGVDVRVYPPQSKLEVNLNLVDSKRQALTPARAMLVTLIGRYWPIIGQPLSLLEVQKLAYFLQESGQDLRLNYGAYKYGPYADNLNHTLQRIDGHLIKGVGDRASIKARIELIPGIFEEAQDYLEGDDVVAERLAKVAQLVEGYEDEFGLELLATVHWVTKQEQLDELEAIIARVHSWSDRKKGLFTERFIEKAWRHLKTRGWLDRPAETVA